MPGTRSFRPSPRSKARAVLIVPSASPGRGIEGDGELESITHWREMLRLAAIEHGIYVDLCGPDRIRRRQRHDRIFVRRSIRAGASSLQAPAAEACIVRADLDLREIDIARASLPLLGDLRGRACRICLLDDELPLPRGT